MDLNKITTVLFDFHRSLKKISYNAIESVKDGFIPSVALNFNNPHVIIFSNFLPDQNKLSEDRWEIYYIDQMDKSLKKINLDSANKIYDYMKKNNNMNNDTINDWVLKYLKKNCSYQNNFFENPDISEYSMDWVSKEENLNGS
jgi:hypothetical protein